MQFDITLAQLEAASAEIAAAGISIPDGDLTLEQLLNAADEIPDHREPSEIDAIKAELAQVRAELREAIERIDAKVQEVLNKYPLL
jgi:rhamnose utilization protein RhaD (predicted bifunctional aldolase and dehydrogenase)